MERRMALTETQAYVYGVCMHNISGWRVPLDGGRLVWPPSPRLTVRRSTARPPLPTPPNGWEGNARDARYVTRRTGVRRGSVNSRSTGRAQDEGGLPVARPLLSRTHVHRMKGERRQKTRQESVARGNAQENCVLMSICQGDGDVYAGVAVQSVEG